MTKNKFIAYYKTIGLTCSYSGNTRTMYVKPGNIAAGLLRHFVVANFSINTKN